MDPHSQYGAVREQIARAIGEVIDSGRFILGPRVREVERSFAEHVGVAHGIGVANGTDALVIALRALGVEPRRRGHLPLVHVLRDRRVDRRHRRDPGLRRHRGRDLQPRPGRRGGRDHAAHARGRRRCTCSATRRRWRPLTAVCGRHGLARARGRRAGVRRLARRRALRRDRRRGDVLVLPHQEPALLRRRRPDHDRERRGRPHLPRAALPRLRGQGRRSRTSATTRAWTSCRRRSCSSCCRCSTAGTTAASPSPPATPSSASASTWSLPAVAAGARHIYHLYVVRSQERERLVAGLAEAGVATRHLLHDAAAPAAGVRAPRLRRGLASR